MTRPNGISTNYSYETLSRLLGVLHQAGASTIDGATYTVDAAGNRTAKTDQRAGVTSNYSYDALYELTQVVQGANTTENYSYDQVGNRLSSLGVSPYSYNVSNELTSTPSATYTYDANGNTTSKTTSSATTSYGWDYENRLTSVTLPGTGGSVTFKYDPFGRRIYKSSSSGTSIYAYDDDGNLVEETNAAGVAVARYAEGLNIDEPLGMLRSGTTSFYNADGLGNITSLANGAGALSQTYTFDSFGKLTASSGSLANPFQYTAREFDSETGLYYYRARYYDPTVGRFISEDSREVSLLNQIKNLYAYVLGNPVSFSDPLGLYRLKPEVDYPNPRISALLDCIEWYVGLNTLLVTSTTEPPPRSPHGPNDPHRRDGGLAVDISYPSDPDAVLNAAACCGAPFARDEKKDPSKLSNRPHIHLQLVPGPPAHNALPKNPKCKGCS